MGSGTAAAAVEAAGFKAADQLTWLDIADEQERTYHFATGSITVPNPFKVSIKRKPEGDSHRVITKSSDGKFGRSFYIPAGWLAISWQPKEGSPAYAF